MQHHSSTKLRQTNDSLPFNAHDIADGATKACCALLKGGSGPPLPVGAPVGKRPVGKALYRGRALGGAFPGPVLAILQGSASSWP